MLKLLKTTLIGVGLTATTLGFAASDITGKYTCQGNDPTTNPSAYTGNVTITQQANGSYVVAETDLQNGQSTTYNQVALKKGDTLSMAFQQSNQLSTFGVEIIKISKDNTKLTGTFVYWGIPDKKGTETCTKVK